jgi:hypothetical protein
MPTAPVQPASAFLDQVEADAVRNFVVHAASCEYRRADLPAASQGKVVLAMFARGQTRDAARSGSLSGRDAAIGGGMGAGGHRNIARMTCLVVARSGDVVDPVFGVGARGSVEKLSPGDRLVAPGRALKEPGGDVVVSVVRVLTRSDAFWTAEVTW